MHEIHLETVDSTQIFAKQHAQTFPKNQITCITAEEQTAGYGRYHRKWISPRGLNILTTFYFRLPPHTPHLISLAQVMTYSCATVFLHEGLHPKIKWPNDVQLSGKKIAGVLCETTFHTEFVELFLGIGINVNLELETAAQIDQPATSLKIETGHAWDKKALLSKLQKQFASDLERFKQKGFSPFHDPFEQLLAYKGQQVRCFDGKKEWIGICHSLTADGQLNLLLPDQTLHPVSSGDLKA